MQRQWQTAALGMAAVIMLAGVAAAAGRGGNQGGNNNGGGSQFRSQSGNNGGGLKLSSSFNSQSMKSSNGLGLPKVGLAPKIGGQTFKPQILNQPKFGRTAPGSSVADSIKKIGINNGPKFDKIGIKPADLGIKTGNKPLDPGFSKNAKPIGIGVIANGNGNQNGNSQSSAKKNNGLGLGIGLGVVKNLMGAHHHKHHNHCHDFYQPNYCWPSSCVSVHCGNYVCPQPIYCLPPVQVIEVVTVIELPVFVEQTVIAPPQPEIDPTALVTATDAAVVQPATTDFPPAAPQGEAATRSLAETPVSTAAAQPADDANLVKIPVGGIVELKGKDLGAEVGQVLVQVGDLMLPATMKEWKPESVKAELPRMGVVNPTKAFLHVVKPDGKFASSLPCLLIAPPQPAK